MSNIPHVRKLAFAQHYAATGNKRESAEAVGYKPGLSAKRLATRLLKDPAVLAEIERIQTATRTKSVIDRQRRMELLSAIAEADLADGFDGEEMTIAQCRNSQLSKLSRGLKRVRTVTETGESVRVSIEGESRIAAIAELNKMDGQYAAAKVEVTERDETQMSAEEIAAELNIPTKALELIRAEARK